VLRDLGLSPAMGKTEPRPLAGYPAGQGDFHENVDRFASPIRAWPGSAKATQLAIEAYCPSSLSKRTNPSSRKPFSLDSSVGYGGGQRQLYGRSGMDITAACCDAERLRLPSTAHL